MAKKKYVVGDIPQGNSNFMFKNVPGKKGKTVGGVVGTGGPSSAGGKKFDGKKYFGCASSQTPAKGKSGVLKGILFKK